MPSPKRPSNPAPDPKESIVLSARPIFKWSPQHPLWLPDASAAMNTPEVELEAADAFDPMTLGKCPSDALHPDDPPPGQGKRDALIAAAASAKAAWIFKSYKMLLEHRLKVYNKYRARYNSEMKASGVASNDTLGKYRRACRLAVEQILRRDLPYFASVDLGYYQPVLPLFEIDLKITLKETADNQNLDYEIVKTVVVKAIVEVRQRRSPGDLHEPKHPLTEKAEALALAEPEWSSSSSMSSESSFDP
jgi:hypothetical protein